jgi:hypothetical protein
MWMLLTVYLVLSGISATFLLSACMLSGRISRREEVKAQAMKALPTDTNLQLEGEQGVILAQLGYRPSFASSVPLTIACSRAPNNSASAGVS